MSQWDDDSRLEAELTERLARKSAPFGFTENVMAALRHTEPAGGPAGMELLLRPRFNAWAVAALIVVSSIVGFGIYHRLGVNEAARLVEAREAEARLVESLQLAGIIFNLAHAVAFDAVGDAGE